MAAAFLEIKNISRSFGGIRAVDSLSFNVSRGEITGLIGPNGAGKTTVFNLITGVYKPDNILNKKLKEPMASVIALDTDRSDGENLLGMPPYKIVRLGVSRTFQNIRLFNRMTCLENVMTPLFVYKKYGLLAAFLRTETMRKENTQVRNVALNILNAMGLANIANKQAGVLSYGLQRKLEIARALACQPRLLLLDEPAAGMNDSETHELGQVILKICKDFAVTILLIEHNINLVMNISKHIIVMSRGQLLAEGTPENIRNNQQVIEAYLGYKKRVCK